MAVEHYRQHFHPSAVFDRPYVIASFDVMAADDESDARQQAWAYLAKHGQLMFDQPAGQTYVDLHKLIHDKNYFIIVPVTEIY